MTRRQCNAGFTMIELAVVVAIVGILGGLAIPGYLGYLDKARIARSIAEIRSIEKSIKLFYANSETYPATLAQIGADNIRDPWGTPYQYVNLTAGAPVAGGAWGTQHESINLWSWFTPSSAHATSSNHGQGMNHGQGNGVGGGQGNSGGGGGGNNGNGGNQASAANQAIPANQGSGAYQASGANQAGTANQGSNQTGGGQSSGNAGGNSNPSSNSPSDIPSGGGSVRQDRFGASLNSDFDLYSMGKDRQSAPPLSALKSYDDIVRASNGDFVGLASDF